MKLTTEVALRRLVTSVEERVAPAVEDGFARGTVRLVQSCLTILADGIDDLAARLWAEAGRIRALFADAAPLVTEASLAQRLRLEAGARPESLVISSLDSECERLRRLLIELHAFVDDQEGEAFADLDQRIWALLAELEAERKVRS